MGMRELAEDIKRQQYFEAVPTPEPEQDEGTRELGVLYPFLISGGSNTERYYFTHINDTTEYRFNIRPRYFGDESSYTEAFPNAPACPALSIGSCCISRIIQSF